MLIKLIRILVTVCAGPTLGSGQAAAQSTAADDLRAALLTQDEVGATFDSSGSDDQVTTVSSINRTPGSRCSDQLTSAIRTWPAEAEQS